jgi:hypothetical protein
MSVHSQQSRRASRCRAVRSALRAAVLALLMPAAAAAAEGRPPAALDPPDPAPVRTAGPEVRRLAAKLDSLLAAGQQPAESLKVRLALALNPDSPNLESPIGGLWPFEWEGMVVQRAQLDGAGPAELLVRLHYAGRERAVTLYLFRFTGPAPQIHELPASELGVQNVLFLLDGTDVLDLYARSGGEADSFPYLLDLDGDGDRELIVHGLIEGFPREGVFGLLYWPRVYDWRRGRLRGVSTEYPGFYHETVLPLYRPHLPRLRSAWQEAGKAGPHPAGVWSDSLGGGGSGAE